MGVEEGRVWQLLTPVGIIAGFDPQSLTILIEDVNGT
jgi:hypothetical protein